MIKCRVDFYVFKEKGLKDDKTYFTGAKWFELHDPLFLLAIENAVSLVADNGVVTVKVSEIKEKEGENDGEKKENG